MVWAKAGSTTLSSSGDTLTVSGMTASKSNMFLEHEIATGNIDNPTWKFNNNANSVYSSREETNGGTDATTTSYGGIIVNLGNAEWDRYTVMYAFSVSSEEKLMIIQTIASNTAGAGNAPARNQQVAKFVPSPDASITRVDVTNGGSGDFDTSSSLSALGSDLTPAIVTPSISAIPPLTSSLKSPSVGGWVELGRTTLGSAGDTITVSGLADKRYYMLLRNNFNSGAVRTGLRLGSGSIDTGNNYTNRRSNIGGSDATNTSTNRIVGDEDGAVIDFNVEYLANLSGEEKLILRHQVTQETAGAGNAPRRTEMVAKWSNTSNPIDTIQSINTESGSFDTNSEIVVLGWDPTDSHTTNFWEELASVDLTAGAAATLSSGTITAKKYLWVQYYTNSIASSTRPDLIFNSDTGSNYSNRYCYNGTESVAASENSHFAGVSANTNPFFANFFIINNSANEKLSTGHGISTGGSGAGTAIVQRFELAQKWTNTSSQITNITLTNDASANFGTSTYLKVWGSD